MPESQAILHQLISGTRVAETESRKTVLLKVNLTDSSRSACPLILMLQFRPATVISGGHAVGGLTTVVHQSTCTPLVTKRIIVSFYVEFALSTLTNTCICLHVCSFVHVWYMPLTWCMCTCLLRNFAFAMCIL